MKALILLTLIGFLTGCAAAQLSLDKRKLDVQTRTTHTFFLNPVNRATPKLFLNIRSGVSEFEGTEFRNSVARSLGANGSGYTLTDYPDEADYLMSVSVSNLEKVAVSAAEKAFEEGYGGPSVTGAVLDLAEFKEIKDSDDLLKTIATVLVVGAVESAINHSVKDVSYMLVTDIEVAERLSAGGEARVDTEVRLTNGDTGSSVLRAEETSDVIKYRTRIVTTANRANLKLEQARRKMFEQMAYAIAGLFAKPDSEVANQSGRALTENITSKLNASD